MWAIYLISYTIHSPYPNICRTGIMQTFRAYLCQQYAQGSGSTRSAWSFLRSYAQGTVFSSSAPVFLFYCWGITTVVIIHRALTMHMAQDRVNCLRPPALILCTGQGIHEFRLVIPLILCTGHSFLKIRAGFSILFLWIYDSRHYAQGRHYANGTGSCKLVCDHLRQSYAQGSVSTSSAWSFPLSYAQGTVFLSSPPVFVIYCRGLTTVVILVVTMHRAQDGSRVFPSITFSWSHAQGTGFTSSAPVFYPMNMPQGLRQSLSLCTGHRIVQIFTRPPASILCSGP